MRFPSFPLIRDLPSCTDARKIAKPYLAEGIEGILVPLQRLGTPGLQNSSQNPRIHHFLESQSDPSKLAVSQKKG